MTAPRKPVPKAPSKPSTLFIELAEFLKRDCNDVAYGDLSKYAREAGWFSRLVQAGADAGPQATVITFDVMIGKDVAHLELFDAITINVPVNISEASLWGRFNAGQTLIYMLFGRLPPQPAAAAAPAPAVNDTPVDEELSAIRQRVTSAPDNDDDGGAEDDPKAYANEANDLVVRRTPSGLPVFRDDLYEDHSRATSEIIEDMLDEIADTLPMILQEDELRELYTVNKEAMEFLKDLGDDSAKDEVNDMIAKRRKELAVTAKPEAEAPRRRRRN